MGRADVIDEEIRCPDVIGVSEKVMLGRFKCRARNVVGHDRPGHRVANENKVGAGAIDEFLCDIAEVCGVRRSLI